MSRVKNILENKHSVHTLFKRCYHQVAIQLDYYMSPQFAGISSALVHNIYFEKGIDIKFLPTCPAGLEQERVRLFQNHNPAAVSIGSVEQNIFIPCLKRNPRLRTTAVAAMFNQSPLCVVSLPGKSNTVKKIGTHDDTVELMQRIYPMNEVVAVPRSTKINELVSGNVDAIQAYTTTEALALELRLEEEPLIELIEGKNGAKIGYSQVLFCADDCLEGDKRSIVKTFCEATFDGWALSVDHPEQAVESVKEAKRILKLNEENNDHWHDSDYFELEYVKRCNEFVKRTKRISDGMDDRYGMISKTRWNEANKWLLAQDEIPDSFGLDNSVY